MPVSDSYRDFVLEQLGRVVPVRHRAMFGGVGIYAGDLFFALIDDDILFFKVDDETRPAFEAAGMEPFTYGRPDGKTGTMGYYRLPADVLEDVVELEDWVQRALAVARRARR